MRVHNEEGPQVEPLNTPDTVILMIFKLKYGTPFPKPMALGYTANENEFQPDAEIIPAAPGFE